ncbi:SRPBCC family protein [Bordetella pseudohinzii]|uniref:Activator of Hsp90 ATPase homolog 1-like protein n=1 Tax=Bordetella pseudohinzii TaxID=1331258 RepID=A0A0J6C5J6_9BORD|nr:SRPBCC domain-containing protein [Bordetella pseudohinzii]ANY16067.1 hypothetical protein BBN53_09245 [Bordetella pseudohinzii]KMM24537.1 hypothetical protein L540_05765 [Bordetella pseudohinzii]KXA78555.1 hypothetical protein AW878_12700 [Bordetella pseudohinzii]KXA78623.1 hypothetical protein AW877_11450 [Bordetella pseudohinzii]CUJ11265.1 Activator of Hsp90 ATPase homolog 1-like protein [Bordetella pseudohinzii]
MKHDAEAERLVLEYELDAPPAKVWRAITQPPLRAQWLPALAQARPVACREGQEVAYRMRDEGPPSVESEVRFSLRPNARGGTTLTIVHAPVAANDATLMLAA